MFPPLFSPPFFPGHFPTPQPSEQFFRNPYPLPHNAIPVGAIIIFPGEIMQQTGQLTRAMTDLNYMPWMICDGSSLLIAEYPDLYRVIGDLYGSNGSDNFNLPDYRGYFLRGVDLQQTLDRDDRAPSSRAAVDPRGVGSTQKDALQDHTHKLEMIASPGQSGPEAGHMLELPNSPLKTGNIAMEGHVNVSDTETRSVNISVNWLIRTQH